MTSPVALTWDAPDPSTCEHPRMVDGVWRITATPLGNNSAPSVTENPARQCARCGWVNGSVPGIALPLPGVPHKIDLSFVEGPTMTDDQKAESPVLAAMTEYAQATRGDWSDFDGRSLKRVVDGWVRELRQPDPSHDIEWHRRDLGLCMAGGGHWCGRWGYCDDECGCVPCAEDRGDQ